MSLESPFPPVLHSTMMCFSFLSPVMKNHDVFYDVNKRSITNIKRRNSLTYDDECYCFCQDYIQLQYKEREWKKSLKLFLLPPQWIHSTSFHMHVQEAFCSDNNPEENNFLFSGNSTINKPFRGRTSDRLNIKWNELHILPVIIAK